MTQMELDHLSDSKSNFDGSWAGATTANDNGLDMMIFWLFENGRQSLCIVPSDARFSDVISVADTDHHQVGPAVIDGILKRNPIRGIALVDTIAF